MDSINNVTSCRTDGNNLFRGFLELENISEKSFSMLQFLIQCKPFYDGFVIQSFSNTARLSVSFLFYKLIVIMVVLANSIIQKSSIGIMIVIFASLFQAIV
jgi:hypothetical protein